MLFIVCALQCEAKPIIEKYKLSLIPDQPYRIFSADGIRLIVSGIGKVEVAAACGYLAGFASFQNASWLNIGVAGHRSFSLGSLVDVNKVTDEQSGINWYPARLFPGKMRTHDLITVAEPTEDYSSTSLYDMEASAFLNAVSRFSQIDLVQVLKVISDNSDNSIQHVDKIQVESMIRNSMENIELVINKLMQMSDAYSDMYFDLPIYEQCLENWHFTQYQKKQLKRILQKTQALEIDISLTELSSFSSSKSVIADLVSRIENKSVQF